MLTQERWLTWITVALATVAQVNSIYDPRNNHGPNANMMMPQVHGDYSKVHTHKARAHEPNYARSDHNLHYHASPHQAQSQQQQQQHQQPIYNRPVTSSSPSTARTETPAQKLRYASLSENSISDSSNPKSTGGKGASDVASFNGLQCPPLESGFFVYIMDCRQYLNCWKGRGYIQSCAPGTLFNPQSKQCDHPSKVECLTSNTIQEYQTLVMQRKPREHSSAYTQENAETTRKILCPPDVIGLREHPTDCRKFLNCNNGATFVQDCGPGTAFNPRISACDHIYNVDCNRYENYLHPRPTQPSNPDAEDIDVESVSYDIDVRFNEEESTEPIPMARSIPLQVAKPVNLRPASSDVRPVYVPPPAPTPSTTTPRMVQASNNYNPIYYRPGQAPSTRDSNSATTELPISDALKMLLKPFMANTDVELNMTKVNSMMGSTTTTKPSLAVLGLNQTPAQNNSAYIASPHYINNELSGYQPLYYGMPTQRPPVPHNPNPNRPHPSPFQPSQSQSFPLIRTRQSTPPPIRSRFGEDSPQWRPMATTRKPTTTTQDPCRNKVLCGDGSCIDSNKVCNGKKDCQNGADERNCSHVGYEIRLSGKHQGRIEVKAFNKWGYVCDDSFSQEAGNVLCRELGYEGGVLELKPSSFYPPHTSMMANGIPVFIMDEIRCQGNESALKDCDFSGWGVHDCNAEEVMGLVCKTPVMTCPNDYWLCDTSSECVPVGFLCDNVMDCADGSDESILHCNAPLEMRLADGPNKLEGRVEVKYRGIWGTICDDDFGVREARVVCRQLGYNGMAEVRKNRFKPGTGQIWLDQVVCQGNETSIDDCMHWHWGEHNCSHGEDVGVRCGTPDAPKQTMAPIRASGGKAFKFDFIEKSSKIYPDSCGELKVDPKAVKPTYGARVIHGGETVYGHHPWQAALRVKRGKSAHWCGAVVISKYHVLTAAHCLIGYPKVAYMIRIGDYNTDTLEQAEIDIFIEDYYIHENFRQGHHMNNDIAVVLLKTPIRFNDYVQPVCLPPKGQRYQEGMNCVISGWGSTQSGSSIHSLDLRAARVPILSDEVCNRPEVYGNNVTEGMFCAGTLDGGVDACEGDSGGPLVCGVERGHTLYGIISWGSQCGHANKPGVYVKVAHYIDWIEEKLKQSLHMYGV